MNATELPERITAAWLRERQACKTQVAAFKKEWPNGARLSPANLRRANAIYLSLAWFAKQILPHDQWVAFQLNGSRLERAYQDECNRIYVPYQARSTRLWAEYNVAPKPVWAELQADLNALWVAYDAEITPLRVKLSSDQTELLIAVLALPD
jgi:hypothetical protein